MDDQVTTLIFDCLLDVRRFLKQLLESSREDLFSDDKKLATEAEKRIVFILDHLSERPVLTEGERADRLEAASGDKTLSPKERMAAAMRALRSTGRPVGRPKDESSRLAVDALTLHNATGLSWREIALILRGCKHKRPRPDRSCETCGESMRLAAHRLEQFLKANGFDHAFPRATLDERSQKEFLELWRSRNPDYPRT